MSSSNIERYRLFGTIAIILLGLVFHELYKSTGSVILGIISPVNESKWEHWKIAFWPVVIVGVIEYFLIKNQVGNYIFSLAIGILAFEAVTFGGIELYEYVIGRAHLLVHMVTFIAGGIVCQLVRYRIMQNLKSSKVLFTLGVLILLIHVTAFAVFTFEPPRIEYFKDSLKGTYGIYNAKE